MSVPPAHFGIVHIMLPFTAESRTCCAITGHNLWFEMGFAHRRRRFIMAKPVTITVQRAVNSNDNSFSEIDHIPDDDVPMVQMIRKI